MQTHISSAVCVYVRAHVCDDTTHTHPLPLYADQLGPEPHTLDHEPFFGTSHACVCVFHGFVGLCVRLGSTCNGRESNIITHTHAHSHEHICAYGIDTYLNKYAYMCTHTHSPEALPP
jgi:hypothetical protein